MRQNQTITVIVPVYNAERDLTACMDSILAQEYRNLQVIAVDDGSADRSAELLDRYAEQDSRVMVIHQQNAGPSAARNRGIRAASGQWLAFVDADDRIDASYCNHLIQAAADTRADVVLACPEEPGKPPFGVFSKEQTKKLIASCLAFDERSFPFNIDAPWGKLFRTELVKENGIEFPETLRRSEDAFFCVNCYLYSAAVGFLNGSGYHYNVHQNTLSKHYSKSFLATLEEVLKVNERWITEQGFSGTEYERAMWFRVMPGIVECENYYFLHPDCSLTNRQKISEYQEFLNRPIVRRAIRNLRLRDIPERQYRFRLVLYKLHLGKVLLWLKLHR